jgi:hypothetical protein
MTEMTWEDVDRLARDREAKKRELVERLTKVLGKEFALNELRFIWGCEGNAILIESFEIARSKARR